ncbi:MAG: hypothetical protein R3C02_05450 [Planctomycetaceae bacterium]
MSSTLTFRLSRKITSTASVGPVGPELRCLTFCSHERRANLAIEQLIGMKVPPAENQQEPWPVAETAPDSPKAQRPQQRPSKTCEL